MLFLRSFMFGVVSMILGSCLPAKSGEAQKNSGTQNPSQAEPSGNKADAYLADIGASSMVALQDNQMQSLAQIAAASSADFTLFQFTGVTCESCKTEGPYMTKVLNKYAGKVSRYLVFPNKASEYTRSEYLNFSSQYMGSAPYVIDDSLSVLKKVRSNEAQFFGLYILVRKDGRGMVLNQDQAYLNVDQVLQNYVK